MLAQEEREGKPASESSVLSQCLMRRQHEVLFLSGLSRLPVHVCRGLGSLAREKLLFLYCFLWLFVNREDVPGIRASDQGLKETEPSGWTASGHPETLLSSGLTPLTAGSRCTCVSGSTLFLPTWKPLFALAEVAAPEVGVASGGSVNGLLASWSPPGQRVRFVLQTIYHGCWLTLRPESEFVLRGRDCAEWPGSQGPAQTQPTSSPAARSRPCAEPSRRDGTRPSVPGSVLVRDTDGSTGSAKTICSLSTHRL